MQLRKYVILSPILTGLFMLTLSQVQSSDDVMDVEGGPVGQSLSQLLTREENRNLIDSIRCMRRFYTLHAEFHRSG